ALLIVGDADGGALARRRAEEGVTGALGRDEVHGRGSYQAPAASGNASALGAGAERPETDRARVGDHPQALRAELAEGGVPAVERLATRPVPDARQQALIVRTLPAERVEGDLRGTAATRALGPGGAERRQRGLLLAIPPVERRRQRLAPDEPPARAARLRGRERLLVDRPLVAQQVADALVDLRVEATVDTAGELEHGERTLGTPREPEHQHLAVGPRALQVGGRKRDARHRRPLLCGEDRERVEPERRRDLARAEHGTPHGARCLVEADDVHPR